jgi:hypothetical protein
VRFGEENAGKALQVEIADGLPIFRPSVSRCRPDSTWQRDWREECKPMQRSADDGQESNLRNAKLHPRWP